MTILAVYEVDAAPAARVLRDMPALAPALEAEIDGLWSQAQARTGGALFNGRVFSADTIAPDLLTGHLTEFRRIVAQMQRPTLQPALRVRPLAVCGVVLCEGGVVLGRRNGRMAYQAGMWQLPPAGSVDGGAVDEEGRVDLRGQMLRELEEELGLPASCVASMRPICLVEHAESHVLDLGYALEVALDAPTLLRLRAEAAHAAEYHPLEVVALSALPARVAALGAALVPTARVFLTRLGLLAPS
ncbi:MAG: NUDIX domain-containing protein [Acidisphaera sp.]|nr:NUDIX domain-containing protein [Acidisphaera sp.]